MWCIFRRNEFFRIISVRSRLIGGRTIRTPGSRGQRGYKTRHHQFELILLYQKIFFLRLAMSLFAEHWIIFCNTLTKPKSFDSHLKIITG